MKLTLPQQQGVDRIHARLATRMADHYSVFAGAMLGLMLLSVYLTP